MPVKILLNESKLQAKWREKYFSRAMVVAILIWVSLSSVFLIALYSTLINLVANSYSQIVTGHLDVGIYSASIHQVVNLISPIVVSFGLGVVFTLILLFIKAGRGIRSFFHKHDFSLLLQPRVNQVLESRYVISRYEASCLLSKNELEDSDVIKTLNKINKKKYNQLLELQKFGNIPKRIDTTLTRVELYWDKVDGFFLIESEIPEEYITSA